MRYMRTANIVARVCNTNERTQEEEEEEGSRANAVLLLLLLLLLLLHSIMLDQLMHGVISFTRSSG